MSNFQHQEAAGPTDQTILRPDEVFSPDMPYSSRDGRLPAGALDLMNQLATNPVPVRQPVEHLPLRERAVGAWRFVRNAGRIAAAFRLVSAANQAAQHLRAEDTFPSLSTGSPEQDA